MIISRRNFLSGLVAVAAPAVIRTPGLLMPVRPIIDQTLIDRLMISRIYDSHLLRSFMAVENKINATFFDAIQNSYTRAFIYGHSSSHVEDGFNFIAPP